MATLLTLICDATDGAPANSRKYSPPTCDRLLPRSALFQRLDRACDHPLIWIWGPPGSGKTSLAASYLAARDGIALWYRLDPSDGDLTTFLRRFEKAFRPAMVGPMPGHCDIDLTTATAAAERAGLYAEAMLGHGPRPAVLVFDDFQNLPGDSPAPRFLLALCEVLPKDFTLIVLSRSEPPAAFARCQIAGMIECLGWPQLRFTAEETAALACHRGRHVATATAQMLAGWLELSGGWATGLAQLMDHGWDAAGPVPLPRVLHDYIVQEILTPLSASTRERLLRASLFPSIGRQDRAQLYQHATDADRSLLGLEQEGFLLLPNRDARDGYSLNPLFRQALQVEARRQPGDDWKQWSRLAAQEHLTAGNGEEALCLLVQAGHVDAMIELILERAPLLVTKGQNATLVEWLGRLDACHLREHPWLTYWYGEALLPLQPAAARQQLEAALAGFDAAGDAAGLYQCWAAIVETYLHECLDFAPLDGWIKAFGQIQQRFPVVPSDDIERRAYGTLIMALAYRSPQLSKFGAWTEHARRLRLEDDHGDCRIRSNAAHSQWWRGPWMRALELLACRDDQALCPALSPVQPMSCGACAHFYGDEPHHDARNPLSRQGFNRLGSLETARLSASPIGVRDPEHAVKLAHLRAAVRNQQILDAALCRHVLELDRTGIHDGRVEANPLPAEENGVRAATLNVSMAPPEVMNVAGPHTDRDRSSCLAPTEVGGPISTRPEIGSQPRISRRHGTVSAHHPSTPISATAPCSLAYLSRTGSTGETVREVRRGLQIARRMDDRIMKLPGYMTLAHLHLQTGNRAMGLWWLQRSLALSREYNGLALPCWDAPALARIYATALDADIEVAHVQSLIRRIGLMPPASPPAPETWPWQLRVYTLGRFAIVRDGQTLTFAGKSQAKPQELLMALIALGGRDVPENRLADALWPDTDADAAYRNLITTLQRLRKLLGYHDAVALTGTRLTLNPSRVWVDIWAFERLLDQSVPANAAEKAILCGKALTLYRQPFLQHLDAPWAISRRQRLSAKFTHKVLLHGQALEAAGLFEDAIGCYLRALEADDGLEAVHQAVIRCYQRQGRDAEARAATLRLQQSLPPLG